jgi:hypothetical protein
MRTGLQALQEGITGQSLVIESKGQKVHFGHLPRLSRDQRTSVSLIPISLSDASVGIVWNKETNDAYSLLDRPSEHLPCLIERSKAAIRASNPSLTGRLIEDISTKKTGSLSIEAQASGSSSPWTDDFQSFSARQEKRPLGLDTGAATGDSVAKKQRM